MSLLRTVWVCSVSCLSGAPSGVPSSEETCHKYVHKFWTPHFTAVRDLRNLVISYPVWPRKLKFGEKKELARGHGIKARADRKSVSRPGVTTSQE